MVASPRHIEQISKPGAINWRTVLRHVAVSRALDDLEESSLLKERKVLYQFSARGHDLTQVLLSTQLTGSQDGVGGYYRSRPLLLGLGLPLVEALGSTMMRAGGMSDGRDIGVVFNMPRTNGACVLPVCGGVGAQYTPAVGWAQALRYRATQLNEEACRDSIAVAHGGEASTATNGFWAALNIVTTERLPFLFFIEDNGYGISVPARHQTPGGNIARNLQSFGGLRVLEGDSADPLAAAELIQNAVASVRAGEGPALIRLIVPRLSGHSGQDTQTYKSDAEIAAEKTRDPLVKLRGQLVPQIISAAEWDLELAQARALVAQTLEEVERRPGPDAAHIQRHVFSETRADGCIDLQQQGGLRGAGYVPAAGTQEPLPQGARINLVTAVRRTLEHELAVNPRMLVFGEDVGRKGGVHAATLGLQDRFGAERVFDTSLSEEGIIGRAVGMAAAGLLPVPEIQFRKYADPAAEQLNDCGTMRWRTMNRFAAPVVVRIPGGFFKCGDPWHSQSNEVQWLHGVGWRLAMPSNAQDAVGLLRSALRGNDPTIFFEHRSLLDGGWARRPYPGDEFVVPFGKATLLREGTALSIITWGAMVERCEQAIELSGKSVDLLDLRTLCPWDSEATLASVRKTHRCLIVHEDTMTAGFGAEIAAVLAKEAFFDLDAPIERLAMPDVPSPHNPLLLDAVLPSVENIARSIGELTEL
ncbi:MAG TPA: transketolase C-terminal domain-containing protein [Steroidobacteraceae bacterium]|jgi:2-oxoisovalerate dehydrogenase E1 component|nr:transketolase C-terminal domain-containing protein [Steroidobacteraceae bacterium]